MNTVQDICKDRSPSDMFSADDIEYDNRTIVFYDTERKLTKCYTLNELLVLLGTPSWLSFDSSREMIESGLYYLARMYDWNIYINVHRLKELLTIGVNTMEVIKKEAVILDNDNIKSKFTYYDPVPSSRRMFSENKELNDKFNGVPLLQYKTYARNGVWYTKVSTRFLDRKGTPQNNIHHCYYSKRQSLLEIGEYVDFDDKEVGFTNYRANGSINYYYEFENGIPSTQCITRVGGNNPMSIITFDSDGFYKTIERHDENGAINRKLIYFKDAYCTTITYANGRVAQEQTFLILDRSIRKHIVYNPNGSSVETWVENDGKFVKEVQILPTGIKSEELWSTLDSEETTIKTISYYADTGNIQEEIWSCESSVKKKAYINPVYHVDFSNKESKLWEALENDLINKYQEIIMSINTAYKRAMKIYFDEYEPDRKIEDIIILPDIINWYNSGGCSEIYYSDDEAEYMFIQGIEFFEGENWKVSRIIVRDDHSDNTKNVETISFVLNNGIERVEKINYYKRKQ